LGNSLFRFAVGRRRELKSIDHNTEMSTGPSGEFIRHRPEIFYSADLRAIRSPELPPPRTLTGTPFLATLTEGKNRLVNLGLMGAGVLLLLLGFATLASKGSAGWIWIILGLILIAIPLVTTALKRRVVIQAEAHKQKEREERDTRNRELLAAYTTALEKLREDPSDAALALVLAENEKLDLPYAVWADTAIGTVLYVGFSTLARVGPERAAEVAELMDRSSDAAGLIAEDARAVKQALYSTILWHFLADDRLGDAQLKIVRAVQEGFGIKPDEVPIDTSSESQFERLRGVDHRNAPRCNATIPLNLNEWCMHSTPIRLRDGTETNAYVTNKRFVVEGAKQLDVPVPKVDDITVDADQHFVTLRASDLKRALEFTATEPIYLAAMIDLATRLDDRPKSFA
jgi:heme exporter protein D